MFNQSDSIALDVLKYCRAQIIQDFLDQEPMIYGPSYRYEKSSAMLNLAVDRYFNLWLGNHWIKFVSYVDQNPVDQRQELELAFAKVFSSLLKKWSILQSDHPLQASLGLRLIDDMQKATDNLIKAGKKADLMRKRLEVIIEKDSVLFDRAIEKHRRNER